MKQFEHVIEGSTVKRVLWMISMLGFVRKIGIMTSRNKRKMKKLRTNLTLRTDHLVGDDFVVMLHIAELCDNGLDLCQDHHFKKTMLQYLRRMIELLRELN